MPELQDIENVTEVQTPQNMPVTTVMPNCQPLHTVGLQHSLTPVKVVQQATENK